MNRNELLKDLSELLSKCLKNKSVELSETSNSKEIEGWDSLANIVFISEIEKKYSIKFSLDDIFCARNIGTICSIIETKAKK